MMTVKFIIEQQIENYKNAMPDLSDNIGYVITQYNYKIVNQNVEEISFCPYGPEPVSKNDAMFYMNSGRFLIMKNAIRLKYSISYSPEFIALCILIPAGIFIDYIGLIFGFIVVLSFLYRIFKIKRQAKEMLADIVYVTE